MRYSFLFMKRFSYLVVIIFYRAEDFMPCRGKIFMCYRDKIDIFCRDDNISYYKEDIFFVFVIIICSFS